MLLGIALSKKAKDQGEGTVYVEYHVCDQCGGEYRLYRKSEQSVEEAFQTIAKMLGNKKDKPDLCYNCQSQVINDQMMLPLAA